MKKVLLASAAVLALLATPALAERGHHDDQTNQQGTTGTTTGGGSSGGTGGGTSTKHHRGSGTGTSGGTGGTGSGGTGSGTSGWKPLTGGVTGAKHGSGTGGTGGGGTGGGGTGAGAVGTGGGGTGTGGGTSGWKPFPSGKTTDRYRGTGSGDHWRDHGRQTINPSIIFGTGGSGYRDKSHFGRSRHDHDYDQYRRAYRSTHRFHIGRYYRPYGWYFRRWTFGDFLPALFFAQRYWIDDYWYYDLPDPPPGCIWVRYGDDALLVDQYSGEIIQVIYGIFY